MTYNNGSVSNLYIGVNTLWGVGGIQKRLVSAKVIANTVSEAVTISFWIAWKDAVRI